jgi:hypothetical protein
MTEVIRLFLLDAALTLAVVFVAGCSDLPYGLLTLDVQAEICTRMQNSVNPAGAGRHGTYSLFALAALLQMLCFRLSHGTSSAPLGWVRTAISHRGSVLLRNLELAQPGPCGLPFPQGH